MTLVSKENIIAALALIGILTEVGMLVLESRFSGIPSILVLIFGGLPLIYDLLIKVIKRDFGSDLLAGIAIVSSVILEEYLAGALVVLMLSGGNALEQYAIAKASSVLAALARRLPNIAHRKVNGTISEIDVSEIAVGDTIVIFPHEVCPVDGEVIEGRGTMDESYLTGEPFLMSKTPGSQVISGAVNGESAISILATRKAEDSRYAKIIRVMHKAEQERPQLRRLGDKLGAIYTPIALALAGAAWFFSADAGRFLAVLVVATPCPLLIAIPVSIIGSISLAAKRGIIIRDPAVLEAVDTCTTMILDKTGTLTYGQPDLSGEFVEPGFSADQVLQAAASVERYSKHPLALAVQEAAKQRGLQILEADKVHEPPGAGLTGLVQGLTIRITSRKKLALENITLPQLKQPTDGLECAVLLDGKYAATYQFRDGPRQESKPFIKHLGGKHGISKIMVVSGDRESEVRYLAERVGVQEIYGSQTPEQKVEIVKRETAKAKTIFVGDGINDAPALLTATVGIALGQQHEVTSEAAGVVIMDSSLTRVDEFFHIGRRMRMIALQSAVGGMLLSITGMIFAATGNLSPITGAITQEVIDVLAIANALRTALLPNKLSDL